MPDGGHINLNDLSWGPLFEQLSGGSNTRSFILAWVAALARARNMELFRSGASQSDDGTVAIEFYGIDPWTSVLTGWIGPITQLLFEHIPSRPASFDETLYHARALPGCG